MFGFSETQRESEIECQRHERRRWKKEREKRDIGDNLQVKVSRSVARSGEGCDNAVVSQAGTPL